MDHMVYSLYSSKSLLISFLGRRKWRGEKWDDPWSARTIRFWPLTMFLTLPSVNSLGVIHFITMRWPYCNTCGNTVILVADQSSRIIFWLLEVFSRETNTSLWDSSFALWQKLGWDNLRWTVFESREETSSSQNAICITTLSIYDTTVWTASDGTLRNTHEEFRSIEFPYPAVHTVRFKNVCKGSTDHSELIICKNNPTFHRMYP